MGRTAASGRALRTSPHAASGRGLASGRGNAYDVAPPSSDVSLLLSSSLLSATQDKVTNNTTQWQAFKSRLDGELTNVTSPSYQADELPWAGDFALGYLLLKDSDATTACAYADKALAIIKCGLHDNQRNSGGTRQYLARGDGSTTVFNLPYTDNIRSASFKVYTIAVQVATITHTTNAQESVASYSRFLKASNTSDGTADYTESVMTSRGATDTWSAGDWRQSPDYRDDYIDWSHASSQPSNGATYYVTYANGSSASVLNGSNYTLNTGAGTVTFNVAPSSNTAIFVEYQYGTPTQGASTLGYQQTGDNRCGFNNIYIDTGYTSRYLGKFVALAYDWLYDYAGFDATLKAEVESTLYRWSNQVRDNGYYKNNPTSNYGAGHYVSRAFTAVAMNGRGATNGASLLSEILTYRTNNTVPQICDTPATGSASYKGGFWAEGWNYGQMATRNVLLAASAFEVAGQATITKEKDWAAEVIQSLLIGQPTNRDYVVNSTHYQGTVYDGGDGYVYPLSIPSKELFYLTAYLSSDSNASAYANYFIQQATQSQSNTFEDLLYRDPNATATNWSSALALSRHHTGTGLILARADWNYDSTWLAFICGNNPSADHQSYSQGNLRIQRGADDLLVDANAVSENQTLSSGSNPAGGKSNYSNTVVCDDGGAGVQNYRFNQGFWYGSPGCQILQFEEGSTYAYTVGDYAASYSLNTNAGNGGSMSELQRSVFFLRPDIVVVYDRATSKSSSYSKNLYWHFIADPTVSGDSWSLTQGSSKLFGTTVSGSTLTTTDDGSLTINGDTSWSYPTDGTTEHYSVYRVSTINSSAATKVRYCTALQTAASGASAYAVTRVASSVTALEGVLIDVNIILFGDVEGPLDTTGGVSYSFTAPAGTTTHYICDLTPSQTYTLSGDASGTATASAAGVITFTTTSAGSLQTVTIT